MKITNNYNLPDSFVKACEAEEKVEGLRVTQLLNGARAVVLTQRHWDEIEQDASEMVWMILGTAAHKLLEMTEMEADEIREHRLSMEISNSIVTGKSDLFKNGKITDYKTTSVYNILYGKDDEWKKQLLLYALLWKENGFIVHSGEIVAILRDHIKTKAEFDKDYPELPIQVLHFDFTDEDIEEIRAWATKKVKIIESLQKIPDFLLPLCSAEERWKQEDKYAVMKNKSKRAKRVFDTLHEAQEYMRDNGGDYIEERKGEDRKCLHYCVCREFCSYAQKLKGEQNEIQKSDS